MSKCEHGRQKSYCKECDGSQICEHERIKSSCKECGGSQICKHGRQKIFCKECCGSQICEHGKRKTECKDCGGISICIHKRNKSECKECGGSKICEHEKIRSKCKECNGGSICIHKKIRTICKECNGGSLCKHKKIKSRCKECNGCYICTHGIIKTNCKECDGSCFCKHGKQKSRCKECGGSSLCKSPMCETRANSKYDGYCLRCFIYTHPEIQVSRNYKTKENDVICRIKESFPDFTWVSDKKVQDGCSNRRPDLLLNMGSHIIMEVDENKHTNYDCSCENKRIMELSQDNQHRPIVFIRFNPDSYTNKDNVLVKSCWKLNKLGIMSIEPNKKKEWEERIDILKNTIKYWIENPTEKTIEIIELFY
jgi:hypothetical protein